MVFILFKGGVGMYRVVVDENSDGQRADKYVRKLLPLAPNNLIYKMFRKKDIKLNGKKINEKTFVYKGDVLELFLYENKVKEYQSTIKIERVTCHFDVVYEDRNVLIVNKPAGIVVHEEEDPHVCTLTHEVLSYLYSKGEYDPATAQGFKPAPVHRLDRNTSGLVIFGKTFSALKDLNEMIRLRHCISKKYMTIVCGELKGQGHLVGYMKKDERQKKCFMVGASEPGALTMETLYRSLKTQGGYSLVEVVLITGRTHQIRLHMASISHPVIGDRKYGDFTSNKRFKQRYGLNHQLLHSYQLRFDKCIGCLSYLEGRIFEAVPGDLFEKISKDLF